MISDDDKPLPAHPCCREPINPAVPRMDLYTRTEVVEAFETEGGEFYAVRKTDDLPTRMPLSPLPTSDDFVFIPADVFRQHYTVARKVS